jgi:hypothetical protein
MNSLQKEHYQEMLQRNRLVPFVEGDRLICFITYFLTSKNDMYKFINPWQIVDDDDKGNTCYISQLITDKHSKNPFLSHEIWARFKSYIKDNHPTVTTISWRRWKGDKINVYNKNIR